MVINVDVNVSGVDELEAATKDIDCKFIELNLALSRFRRALFNLGVEINQPPAGYENYIPSSAEGGKKSAKTL